MDARHQELCLRLRTVLPPAAVFTWEIGCGHGHFLTAFAQSHPATLCVGIDIAQERIERANRKQARAKLSNLHFVRADALGFLQAMAADATFAAIYILFPDPWPKLRHNKHRLMQSDFLRAAAQRAGEGVRLYFRTDHESYFESAHQTLSHHPDWQLVDEPWPFEHETVFQKRAPSHRSLVAARKAIRP